MPWWVLGTEADSVCVCVRVGREDYLWDGLYKTDAIVSSLDLNQAVAEVIPVVFSLAKKGCLLFLVELRNTNHYILMSVCCSAHLSEAKNWVIKIRS